MLESDCVSGGSDSVVSSDTGSVELPVLVRCAVAVQSLRQRQRETVRKVQIPPTVFLDIFPWFEVQVGPMNTSSTLRFALRAAIVFFVETGTVAPRDSTLKLLRDTPRAAK